MSCAYCSLPEIRAREIAGDGLAWVFPTNIPITPGHLLIAPRRCVARFSDLAPSELAAIKRFADRAASALTALYGAEGFNFAWNEGKLAGQSVPHFHLHLIPRKEGDAGVLGYDPRSMLYRTGDREPTPESELLRIAQEIRRIF